MILQIDFNNDSWRFLPEFLTAILGKTRINFNYEIEYSQPGSVGPVVTISNIGNSGDLLDIVSALDNLEDSLEAWLDDKYEREMVE